MAEVADVVVIGSGGFGASVAYNLARRGLSVALLDRYAMASQTSPRAAGIAATVRTTDVMTRLAKRAVDLIGDLAEELDHSLGLVVSGGVKLARTEVDVEILHRNVETARRNGIMAEIVDGERVPELNPLVKPDRILGALWVPTDAYFEPSELAVAFVGAAARHGARLLPNRAVTGIRRSNGRVTGVDTVSEPIEAPIVIDCAGAWAGQIAAAAGHPVPMVPTRHQLLITEPIEGVRPEHAILRIIDAAVYGRTSWDGFLLGGYETDPLQFDDETLKPPFEMRDTPLDFSVLQRLVDQVADTLPAVAAAPVRVHRGGVPTMTVDGQHLVGPVPGAEGMWIAAGCNVAGLSISPVIGELLGEWIVEGQPTEDLSLMSLTRFGPEWRDPARIREAAAHHYATFYRSTI